MFQKAVVDFEAEVIGVPEAFHIRFEFGDELREVGLHSHGERFLDDVVAVLVEEEVVEGVSGQDLPDHGLLHFVAVVFQALLNHVGGKLLFAQGKQRSQQPLPNQDVHFQELQLQYVLDHVVSVGVPDKDLGVLSYLRSEGYPLLQVRPVYALLHHTTPVLVTCYLHTLVYHRFVNELVVLWFPGEEYLLDDVVAVDIFCQLLDFVLEETDKEFNLIGLLDGFDDFLDGSGAVSVFAETHGVFLDFLHDLSELFFPTALRDFLGQVIAERVIHQLHIVLDGVSEDYVHVLLVVLFNLLLQEPAPTLVSRQH